jgi:AcrR family transcriptional regulator
MAGLRELKKRQTRERIAAAAADLFRRRGFDEVTVDDVARAATVSRQTVFNYFPTKEAMVFDRDAEIEAALVAAIRDREPGTTPVAAFRRHTRAFWERLEGVLRDGPLPHGFWEIIRNTPSLVAYAEVMSARHARSVAAALAAESGRPADDPVCHGIARALCGANASVLGYGLERLVTGDDPPTVVSDALAKADEIYGLLAGGLDGASAGSPHGS